MSYVAKMVGLTDGHAADPKAFTQQQDAQDWIASELPRQYTDQAALGTVEDESGATVWSQNHVPRDQTIEGRQAQAARRILVNRGLIK